MTPAGLGSCRAVPLPEDFMTRSDGCTRPLAVTLMLACHLAGCAAISPPVTRGEIAGFTAQLSEELAATPGPPDGVLTADGAVYRAVMYNHAVRAKEREVILAEARAYAQSGAMLPGIVVNSDYYKRDRPLLSRSDRSDLYATSTDTRTIAREIGLSWNILDFGLSFVRTRQGLDEALRQAEEARRVTSRLIEETRSIYWRAVAFETIAPAMARLDKEVEAAMEMSRMAAGNPALDPMEPITYQRELLNLQRELNELLSSLAGATDQLKHSIGSPGLQQLQLETGKVMPAGPRLAKHADEDVQMALLQRSEIRQQMYDLRITADEAKATVLRAVPGATFSRSFAADSNSFLFHSHWVSWGAQLAGNLINIVRLPSDLAAVDAQQAVNRQNALSVAATVVMQVHVARARLWIQDRAYRDARRFADIQRSLMQQVRASVAAGKTGPHAIAREKLATLLAEARAIIAYADVEAARAAYATARGDPVEFAGWLPRHQEQG